MQNEKFTLTKKRAKILIVVIGVPFLFWLFLTFSTLFSSMMGREVMATVQASDFGLGKHTGGGASGFSTGIKFDAPYTLNGKDSATVKLVKKYQAGDRLSLNENLFGSNVTLGLLDASFWFSLITTIVLGAVLILIRKHQ